MNELLAWLKKEKSFLLIAHVSPDGDTIGSCLALMGILSSLGKRVQVCCDQPVPKVYRFLPGAQSILLSEQVQGEHENVIAIDCADIKRMGDAKELFINAKYNANIDHHRTNAYEAEYILRDANACAAGELIFDIWNELYEDISECPEAQNIAQCLFTAIATDSGSFAYSNTTPKTFRTAARLLELGIDIAYINRQVYRTISFGRTCLKGHLLSNIELYGQGRVSYAFLSNEDLLRFNATGEDLEGMIDSLRDIDTVEIAILVRQARDATYKVTMRSKAYADVCAIAKLFNGGGHIRAAGCTISDDWSNQRDKLIELAIKAL